MGRRRKSEYAISLFSFQDIITSVSGILVLVVLLLSLELSQRKISTAAEGGYRKTASQVRAEQARIAAEVRELEAGLAETERLIRMATENPQGLLRDRIESESAATETLKNDLAVLEGAAKNLDRAEDELGEARDDLKDFDDERLRIELRIASAKRAIAQMSDPRSVSYTVPRGIEANRAWLCDVRSSLLRLHLLESETEDRRPPRELKVLNGERDEALSRVRDWIRSEKPQPGYVLFLIRPEGSWIDRVLRDQGGSLPLPFGVELIGADQVLVDGRGRPLR